MSWCQRYKTSYGLPAGRPEKIPDRNKDNDYIEEFVIDEANKLGNLNVGIYVVRRKSDGKKCVQKRIDGTNKQLRTEIHLLHHLKSANIVEFVDAYITPHPRQASLYIEYCELGSLSALVKSYVEKNPDNTAFRIPEAFIWHVFICLAKGLQYIHHGVKDPASCPVSPCEPSKDSQEGDERIARQLRKKWPTILHRDIKLGNILLSMPEPQYLTRTVSAPFPFCFCTSTVQEVRDQYPRVILADFGVAIAEGDERWPYKDTDPAGTVNWLPPEMPAWEERGEVWAAAAVVLALCQLKPSGPLPPLPPDRDNAWEWFSSKECRKGFTNFKFSKTYSGALRLVLRTCLQDDKTKRPYAFRLLSYIRACRKSTWDLGKPKFEKLPHWVFSK